jgi:hypothetical protein
MQAVEVLQHRLQQIPADRQESPLQVDGAPDLECAELKDVVLKMQQLLELKESGNK